MTTWVRLVVAASALVVLPAGGEADTVAVWLFDEQVGIYPSSVLGDAHTGKYPLVLGRGGQIVPGKFGNALEAAEQAPITFAGSNGQVGFEGPPKPVVDGAGNAVEPLAWPNANFSALMTRGENHLRKEVGFASPTHSPLNLGNSDWTVEFWYAPAPGGGKEGVVFEIGSGPRGVQGDVTRLVLHCNAGAFFLLHCGNKAPLRIPTDTAILAAAKQRWFHLAFVFDATARQLRHYVHGVQQPLPEPCSLPPLPPGEEDYMVIGRDGNWLRPLPGKMDEFRISTGQVYRAPFEPPGSFSRTPQRTDSSERFAGPPLLFGDDRGVEPALELGDRKHLFIDDAILAKQRGMQFRANPPRKAEQVLENFAGHLIVFQDKDQVIRLYGQGPRRSLAVMTSTDGVSWTKPDLGREFDGARNVVIEDPVGLGTLFVDPNAPPEERIKYVSGYRGRGIYVYSSPDGYTFRRNETSALPFRGASQSIVYYDDQRQVYVGFHRSDAAKTIGGKTSRSFVMTETTDIDRPWPFQALSQQEQLAIAAERRISDKIPYYLDNGPLTPPGFGTDYPTAFATDESLDPLATDIYVPKCVKYSEAPDTYLAFPVVYFHYQGDGPKVRQLLGEPERNRGSGPLETQLATSRDGIVWKRYPRPTYIDIGSHGKLNVHRAYIAQGLVRRGDEIWQYYLGEESYHSPWERGGDRAVFRVVQRLDGFVAAEASYTGGEMVTRPIQFDGHRLVLNIDTGAVGYAQIGIQNQDGSPIDGFEVDNCVYINGDHIDKEVEWVTKGKDVSELVGRPVRIFFRMRGTSLFSMQFVD